MSDIQERLEHYEAQDRERQEREAEIVRLDLQLLAYARTHATLGDDYRRQYALLNAKILYYVNTYGTKAQERLKELRDDAREKFQERAQELAKAAGIEDGERQELADKIKEHDLNLFRLARDKNEPDEEFRAAYIQQGQLLRQYREKYGREAEEKLRDQLYEARRAYAEQDDAERSRKELKKQVRIYRGAIRYYRNQLNESRDETAVLRYALDMFTDRHPEHAEEIRALIDISKDDLEED